MVWQIICACNANIMNHLITNLCASHLSIFYCNNIWSAEIVTPQSLMHDLCATQLNALYSNDGNNYCESLYK